MDAKDFKVGSDSPSDANSDEFPRLPGVKARDEAEVEDVTVALAVTVDDASPPALLTVPRPPALEVSVAFTDGADEELSSLELVSDSDIDLSRSGLRPERSLPSAVSLVLCFLRIPLPTSMYLLLSLMACLY